MIHATWGPLFSLALVCASKSITYFQTERLERRLKLLDFACVTVFPLLFATFNAAYWITQYSLLADLRSGNGGGGGVRQGHHSMIKVDG